MAFDPQTAHSIATAKVFMVGAGGIGCELLKNLLLTGFRDIQLIDLDTIEVSNLNRQFLFRSEHVGKPKAEIAAQSGLELCPEAKITFYHESVIQAKFNVKFFSQFDLVLNALDNAAARSHVNRMCLAADRPLIESGSSGYLGNCKAIFKGKTECFDCQPPAPQKTFPGCTIRNTPSEPIHCIVWAKHLFNQLFGEADPDQDVSPNTADPSLLVDGQNGTGHHNGAPHQNGSSPTGIASTVAISTREQAVSCGYNAITLFEKLFRDDIAYLLSMEKLWEKRRKPVVLDVQAILREPQAILQEPQPLDSDRSNGDGGSTAGDHEDKRVWGIGENARVFIRSVRGLKASLEKLGNLVWDKDDEVAMDFVTAVANLRSSCFGIATLSRYDIKQMAGNIIAAVASTNAIVAGFIICNAVQVLRGNQSGCYNIITRMFRDAVPATAPKRRIRTTGVSRLDVPRPGCVSCSERVEIGIKLRIASITVKEFEEKVVKGYLKMSAPDVELDDASGKIIISSDDAGEGKNRDKPLAFFGIQDGTRLKCEDSLLDDYEVTVTLHNDDHLAEDTLFLPLDAHVEGELAQPTVEPFEQAKGIKRKLEEEILTPGMSGNKRVALLASNSDAASEPNGNGNGLSEDVIDMSHRF
ncbi:SUMO-activating enzyme subunit 2 [Hypsibius exemplaris]|uniref:SUMO-activating enzyme subunit n=1 Tax=Hypsibius exemplaris TaxID=2072580 RepID=A0A1W0X4F8_HYPEX|nr:SUMO-activating enzyme subunit 2 [Hypsibius exemplaris]